MWTSRWRRGSLMSLHWYVILFAVVICALLLGFAGWRTWKDRSTQINEYKADSANLARSLSQQAHDTLQATDTALVNLVETVEAEGLAPAKLEHLRRLMAHDMATLPLLHGLFVYDATGNWIVNSSSGAPGSLNNADREYFKYHRENPDHEVHIGRPVRSRSDGKWIVTVSRRLNDAGGGFAGLALATISVDALQGLYETFDVGQQGAIALFSDQGLVLARKPVDQALIGTSAARGPVFHEVLGGSPAGSFRYVSLLDGVSRLGSYRRVDGYPLVVVVSYGLDEILADWRADARLSLAVILSVVLMVAVLGARLALLARDRQEAEARYRLLADHSGDAIVCVGMDGIRRYVSPAFATLTGWSVEENAGQEWARFVHPEDQAAVRDIGRTLSAGLGHATSTYRYVCKDGSHLWVEAHFVLVPPTRFAEAQFVATIRDIAARKLAEDRLAEATRELAAQATTDGLTGLANRRKFDEVLEQEWRRGTRDAKPLSLLLIDVDRFKAYNDRFGHQKGDQVLRSVAAAIAHSAKRPGDLVARYGGEEIVVVLAETPASSAAIVAERVRAAVESMRIEHPDATAGCVTISIGVATAHPGLDDGIASSTLLITAADVAVYAAKQAGRNRVLVAPLPEHAPNGDTFAQDSRTLAA